MNKLQMEVLENKPHPIDVIRESHRELDSMRKSNILLSKPVITFGDINLIYPNTINLITGQIGTHKSRFAEHLISTIISKDANSKILDLSYKRSGKEPFVLWIDTERPQDLFATSIQSVLQHGGYDKKDCVEQHLYYTSFVEVEITERLAVLEEILKRLCLKMGNKQIWIFLDVLQDLIPNFNDPIQSTKLMSTINRLKSQYDATLFLLIHDIESKDRIKAKGHIGSIAQEKATTIMSLKLVV